MGIGYVISKYPAISHTFIQREILALRSLGAEVHTFSVRKTSSKELLTESDADEAQRTVHLLPTSFSTVLKRHAAEFVRNPLRYFATLWFAVTHRNFTIRNLIRSVCYFGEAILLAYEARRRNITRLHSHFVNSGGEVSLIASQHLGIPWSCTLHGLSDYGNPLSNRLAVKIALADKVICVTDYGRAQAMLVSEPRYWNKLHVVSCGLDDQMLVESPLPTSRDVRLKLVTVGRLSPEKAHSGMIEAVRTAVDRGADVQLRIICDGPLSESLKKTILDLNLTDRVTLCGAQPPSVVRRELAAADVCVMSSLMEGLPAALMESLACGRPVIAPAVAGIPELVHHGQNGWLFTASRWDQLADQIVTAASQRDQFQEMGRRGREIILQHYTIAKSARLLTTILRLQTSEIRDEGESPLVSRRCQSRDLGVFDQLIQSSLDSARSKQLKNSEV